ncbi:CPBP family intramembrane glutamic endopeptidase [Cohnella hashimotonis]|uniref:CPBP family intramembrane metalloprotease n=1 Tax=Cohnella hashimotonis TaxID=2826895 RepID=A0ABT6TBY2_9BACL|nr:CPBP family intramembrane glutamic endopeptidase [Cohnella hashimotonis]MDI4644342.1 CPBP family intramembrane metalloprotease [Cohnella hashimotonis]
MRSSKWAVAAGIGLLIFLFMQVLPAIAPAMKGESKAIGRGEAKRIGLAYAAEHWGMDLGEGSDATITHVGDDRMAAYMTKHKLTDEYDRDWDARYPTDVYAVDIHAADGSVDRVSIHMETGKVVGWARVGDAMTDVDKAATGDVDARTAEAIAWLKTQPDYDASAWEPTGSLTPGGSVVLQSRKTGLSDAHVQLLVKPDKVLTYRYALPQAFADEIAKQRKIADKLSMTGFLLPQIVMFVLAVIYAAACRGWTSFKRGLFLSAAFFVMYAGFMFNLRPGLRASSVDMNAIASENNVSALLVTNVVILFIQALLTYFAAVGGDGLWRSLGRSLWPRWQDADYGSQIMTAMKQGYMLAVILLAAQAIVLTALGLMLGTYYGSDPSQSAYNMYYPWLLPLLAWCAGISEEIQTRFFGIGLVRKWLGVFIRSKPAGSHDASGSHIAVSRALTAIAVLPATAVWAFGHVGYAVFPWQTRFIELMIIGALFAWFMLRFGLLTVIFAHVVLDSTLMAVQMLSDGLSSDNLAGLVSVLLPAAVAMGIAWLHQRRKGGSASSAGFSR